MPKDPNFSHLTLDTRNRTAPRFLINETFRHSGNLHYYQITDIVWIGDTDQWGIEHKREGSDVKCVRSYDDFFGNRSNGVRRFNKKS